MKRLFSKLLNLSRNSKRLIMICADILILPIALWVAFALRLGVWRPDVWRFWWLFIAAPLLAIPVFIHLRLYRAVVHCMGSKALITILKGVSLATVALAAVVLGWGLHGVPRTVFVIYWGVALLFIGASRMIARNLIRSLNLRGGSPVRMAIYGAGSAGSQLAASLRLGHEYIPVAFFDDNKSLHGHDIHGVIVYNPDLLPSLVEELGIKQILLALPSVSRTGRKRIISKLESLPVRVMTLPGVMDLVDGRVRVEDIREVKVTDLLERDPAVPNKELLALCVHGRTVMVTGAGGSIGSELCRQILRLEPDCILLLERSEAALYRIEKEIEGIRKEMCGHVKIVSLLGSVHHRHRMETIMRSYGVQTVYHAAAYKHVPLVEMNPIEGIRNNVFGTWHAAEAALAAGVEVFVLVSTDKAVRPTNVMGASKRLAELILQGLQEKQRVTSGAQRAACNRRRATTFCMVRFGNVLDSSGSVVPRFREQIKNEGPITITHPEITRYFMSIPEAAQLVIQSGSMGRGGDVFVLDMGEPVRIYDLSCRMIRLSGLSVRDEKNPEGDIAIEFTGLRPGEKLYEEVLIGDNVTGTAHPLILRALEESLSWSKLEPLLQRFDRACQEFDCAEIRQLLHEAVKNYNPQCDIQDPVWLKLKEMRAEADISNIEDWKR